MAALDFVYVNDVLSVQNSSLVGRSSPLITVSSNMAACMGIITRQGKQVVWPRSFLHCCALFELVPRRRSLDELPSQHLEIQQHHRSYPEPVGTA